MYNLFLSIRRDPRAILQSTLTMARAQKNTQPESRISAQVSTALRESALYVFGVLAFILWYALFTYDPSDPSFSQATSSDEIRNGIGRLGALVSGLLFDFFGRPAYLFTVMVFYLGWMLYREQKTQQLYTKMDYSLRVGGFVLTGIVALVFLALRSDADYELCAVDVAFLGRRIQPDRRRNCRVYRRQLARIGDEAAWGQHIAVRDLGCVAVSVSRHLLVLGHGQDWALVPGRLRESALQDWRAAGQGGRAQAIGGASNCH